MCYRCGQPAQQQGRRMPPFSLESAFLILISLVSAFLPEVTQQIHSFRASGVISSQTAFTAGLELIACFKSLGSVCIKLFYQIFLKIELMSGDALRDAVSLNRFIIGPLAAINFKNLPTREGKVVSALILKIGVPIGMNCF